jgi:hypothetical protein
MIRKYKTGDETYLAQIYHDAIYQLAAGDYSQEQLDAWVNSSRDSVYLFCPGHKKYGEFDSCAF